MNETLSNETVQRMVTTVRPDWTVCESSPVDSATDAVHYVTAETPDGPVECVLKACTAVPPADFRPEPYIFTLLERRTAVPGPRVVGAVDNHDDLPSPFFLMERCEGVTVKEADLSLGSLEQVARAAGQYAGEYHAAGEFQRFGRLRLDCDVDRTHDGLTVDGRTLAVADEGTASWRSWVKELYGNWIDDLDDRFVDLRPALEAFIESRMDALGRSFDAVLGHIDYKHWNVLVRPESAETTAVLDWGHATAMESTYDLYLTEEHLCQWAPLDSPLRRRIRTALETGYAETNDLERDADFDERRELYLAVSRLQPLVWFSEWMADTPKAKRREVADRHRQFVFNLLTR